GRAGSTPGSAPDPSGIPVRTRARAVGGGGTAPPASAARDAGTGIAHSRDDSGCRCRPRCVSSTARAGRRCTPPVTSREFQDRLRRRARRAGVTLTGELGSRLEAYFRLLTTWNEKINLTGIDLSDVSPEALDRLLIEPLVAARYAPV